MKNTICLAVITGLLGTTALFAQAKQQPKITKEEAQAFNAVQTEQDPTKRMAAADTFVEKFADSQLKPMILLMAAQAAAQKNDADKMVIYCERAVDAYPKPTPPDYPAVQCMLMLSGYYSTKTREFDLDKEEKLAKADGYAKQALDLTAKLEKPNPQITDDQWTAAKKDLIAQAHENLGNADMVRKKYDAAITEYKESVDGSATMEPSTLVRLANAYDEAAKYDDAIATADRALAIPNIHPQIKQAAQQVKNKATALKAKAAGAAPAAPAASTPEKP
jgi:tetratricopeptide (TPR) repeat protein